MIEHECVGLAMALAQFHAEGRLLYVEGARSRGDQHQVTYSHAALDQVDPGRTRVDENPIPALADQQFDRFDCSIDLEQFRVLRLAATGPPAGKALLRIEIEEGHSPALARRAHGKRTADRGLADAAFGVRGTFGLVPSRSSEARSTMIVRARR